MNRGVSILEAVIGAEAEGWRLDRALASAIPTLSRERIKALISAGNVRRGDGVSPRDPALKARAGESFEIEVPAPRPAHNEAQDLGLKAVFEDDHLIVIDKPAG